MDGIDEQRVDGLNDGQSSDGWSTADTSVTGSDTHQGDGVATDGEGQTHVGRTPATPAAVVGTHDVTDTPATGGF